MKRKTFSWLLTFLFLLLLLIVLSTGKRGIFQLVKVKQKTNNLRLEIEAEKKKISHLNEEKEKFKTPEYKEKVARENYGMAKKNEKVYYVVPKEKKKEKQ